jgi:hypothetical protein
MKCRKRRADKLSPLKLACSNSARAATSASVAKRGSIFILYSIQNSRLRRQQNGRRKTLSIDLRRMKKKMFSFFFFIRRTRKIYSKMPAFLLA